MPIKYKYSCIKPEDMEKGTLYTFSYNPEEQPLFEKFYKSRLNNLSDWSQKQIELFNSLKYCEIECVIEISQKARFHYHGYIMITDIVKFFIHDLAKLRHYGTYEIDKITDSDKWKNYIYKQKRFMYDYCNANEMTYEYKKPARYDIW